MHPQRGFALATERTRSCRYAALLLTLTLVVMAMATYVPAADARSVTLTAMSRNLYLGTDLVPIAAAPDQHTFEQRIAAG